MRIIINATSSGGHIYPAISLAESLLSLKEDAEIIFFGSDKPIDRKIFKKYGFKSFVLKQLRVPSPRDNNLFIFFLKISVFLLKFIVESVKTFILLAGCKADVVVGFGGINSIPVICCARLLGAYTLIHEQNVYPGLANRFLSRIVHKTALGYEQTKQYLGYNSIYTGNPIRSDLKIIDKAEAQKKLGLKNSRITLLVFGGSQGSDFLNKAIFNVIDNLSRAQLKGMQILHITGAKDVESIKEKYIRLNIEAEVFEYIFDMSYAYSASDIVLCRAGAITLAEICYFGLPSILVPYPYAGDHQMQNAKLMQESKAAFVLSQNKDCLSDLQKIISRLIADDSMRLQMSQKSKKLFSSQAADNIARFILNKKIQG